MLCTFKLVVITQIPEVWGQFLIVIMERRDFDFCLIREFGRKKSGDVVA